VALAILVLVGLAHQGALGATADVPKTAPGGTLAAAAPAGLVQVAADAARLTGVSANVLLAISQVECDFGGCRTGLPDAMVPADLRRHVDAAALQPGGETARLLGLDGGRRVGDWVNPEAVAGGQHAMGFMQFLPSTWRHEAPLAPGRPADPYRPYDALVAAGSYLARLERGAVDGRPRDLRTAVAAYGGDGAYADRVLALAAA
jgi:membrane-bound lytic murein transglycosylase B